ncbi:hypothetical protein [Aliirhizobium smilacinae]|uniref:Uncharacterized protein n=1 Tax=Aliirhizobium smilacinae TaxID=1395944 RepID=A0A5C4XRP8_9HYPH|nr:hypothetical protein [Rhizobium smilacinae]TNM65264.1 hypothetical protein FHP24_03000 [Rhizobium smilacinae]
MATLKYAFGITLFLMSLGIFYLTWTNQLQSKEANRLGVPVREGSKWYFIDVNHPRCSEELRHAYRKTNRLFWLTAAALVFMIVVLTWLT